MFKKVVPLLLLMFLLVPSLGFANEFVLIELNPNTNLERFSVRNDNPITWTLDKNDIKKIEYYGTVTDFMFIDFYNENDILVDTLGLFDILNENGSDLTFSLDVDIKNVTKIVFRNDNPIGGNVVNYIKFYTISEIDIDEPLNEVNDLLMSIVNNNDILLTWTNPTDLNYLRTNVYLDGELINESTNSSLQIKDLKYDTVYNLKVTTIDIEGNESPGVIKSIKTEKEPPKELQAPANVSVKNGNGNIFISWERVKHEHLKGYNVYINGQKVTSNPINKTTYIVNDLTNGEEYDVVVSAVADDGKDYSEEKQSSVYKGIPTENSLPIVGMKYSLSDLVASINSMFGSIWLILAFSVAIPLAVYVAVRIKALFVQ